MRNIIKKITWVARIWQLSPKRELLRSEIENGQIAFKLTEISKSNDARFDIEYQWRSDRHPRNKMIIYNSDSNFDAGFKVDELHEIPRKIVALKQRISHKKKNK